MRAKVLLLCLLSVSMFSMARGRAEADDCAPLARHAAKGAHLVYAKSEHLMCLFEDGKTVWSAPASHGRKDGKKQFEGDLRTPEGTYTLSPARASAKFGQFLHISYPSAEDTKRARAQGKRPGGAVGIHGPQAWYAFLGSWITAFNHSEGCIVVDEPALAALVQRVVRPLPITIVP